MTAAEPLLAAGRAANPPVPCRGMRHGERLAADLADALRAQGTDRERPRMDPVPRQVLQPALLPGAGRAAGPLVPPPAASPDLERLPADLAGPCLLDEVVRQCGLGSLPLLTF